MRNVERMRNGAGRDPVVERPPASGDRRLVDAGGSVELSIGDEGRGEPVVLLHGWPVTAYHWRHTVPALVDAGLRALTLEARGLGGASHGSGPFDKETLAGEAVRALDALGVRRFALVGHDWGGTLAYLVAAGLGDRVRALVIEEEILPGVAVTIPEPGRSHYPSWHGPFNRAPGLAEALVPGREDAYHGAFLRQSAGPEPLAADAMDAYLAAYRDPSRLAASVGYYRSAAADAEAVGRRARTKLAVPVLTIGGEHGMGRAVEACFAQVCRQVEHLEIPGAGHYPAEQRPPLVNPALVAFLAGR